MDLSKSERHHILTLIDVNEREGWYYGNKAQYWRVSESLKAKLQPVSEKTKRESARDMKADMYGYNGNG